MKTTFKGIAAVCFLSGVASAAVLVPTSNFTGSPVANPAVGSPLLTDATGTTGLTTRVFAGSFLSGTPDFLVTSDADIISAFTANGAGAAFTAPGLINTDGFGAGTSTDGSDSFTGNLVYLLVGNAATLGASTEVMVFSTGQSWAVEVEGVGGALSPITLSSANLERGIVVSPNLAAPFAGFNGNEGLTFGVVPEPSIALLGALGILGLLRRRR
ncbi:hypothetical protein [Haloferula sp. A504]|uniref:hypothetical protein n=1 Tax=Haloferula sp. A504 TaxID=3373601 RepID=UPI0031C509CF|nr:hypothetical protein [Verrucomicrobiaceae bacterium E54]